ncbi:hypothetical protein Tco_0855392 [Tanacetum coccineum]
MRTILKILSEFIDNVNDPQTRGVIDSVLALLDSDAYKTYYAIASGAEPPKLRKNLKKSNSTISSEESPSKKNGSGDGTDFESGVPIDQHRKTTGADEGTGTLPRVPDVPKYDSESKKESWGDSGEEEEDDDDENDYEDESNNGDNEDDGNDDDDSNDDGNDGDNNDDDNDNQEEHAQEEEEYVDERVRTPSDDKLIEDDKNDDEKETDSDRIESARIKIPILNQSTTEYYEEEEKIDDEENMDEEEDDEVTKELYNDVNENVGNRDVDMTDSDQGGADQQNVSQESGFEQVEEDAHVTLTPVLDTHKTDEPVQSSYVSSDFTSKLLNLENPSSADNEIASLMDTTARYATTVPEITSVFTTTIPPPPPFFNPIPQQATPTPTPTTSEATTSFPLLLDFSSVFKFNDRVTSLEKDLSKIKQVDQYAQALSSIPAIVDRYIDNKLGKAIQKAIMKHNLDCREEAQDEKRDYIELFDTLIRNILKEEKNVTESLKAAVLTRSSSQPKSTYEAATSLSEFDLTKILIDKMEKNKSYDKADYKRELYDALVKYYQIDKDLFDSYGEVFTLKRSQDDKDKDQDPSAGSDRVTKRRKSSKEAESSRDSRIKSLTRVTMMNNPLTRRFPRLIGSRNPNDLQLLILIGIRDNMLTPDLLRPRLVKLLVLKNLSPVKVIYDKYAYWGISHWGPKRQHFYGFAANMSSSKDVYSRKRIIAVTRLTIMKKYDYGHLEEIEVRRDDQKLYKFREEFSDGTLNDVQTILHNIDKGIMMQYLPKRKWTRLDKRRALVMVQDIDKQLYERRLMRNLKKFVGGREYGNDLRLLERTI